MNKMKKISIITIILYMFFITSSFASTATIDVNSARLREEANTTSKVLTNIYKGEKVEILEKNGEWYKVKYGSNTGYLKNTLIKEDTEKVDKKEEKQENKNTNKEDVKETSTNTFSTSTEINSNKAIANSTLNIRYQPNMMSNIILQVEKNTELNKIAKVGNWYQVSNGEISGWVLEGKVSISNSQMNSSSNENNKTEDKNETTNTTNTVKETNTVTENKITNTVNNAVQNTNKTQNNSTSSNTQNQVTSVNKKAKVNVETAKVRKSADKTAKVIGFLDYNDEITITAEEGEWYKFTEKDTAGYVHKTLVALIEDGTVSSRGTNEERECNLNNENLVVDSNETSKTENSSNINSNKGQEVVELAKKYLGYKYVVGGKNPESGFDCSGFTRYVYLQFGYSLGATASSQNNLGIEISRENLKPGDLILFYDEGKTKIGHTGIYISNGDFIHSANPQRGVVIDNLNTNSYYNERYIVAKRIVE